MQSVSIVGIGQMPVRQATNGSLCDMAAQSLRLALHDAGAPRLQALFVASACSGAEAAAAQMAADAGRPGIAACTIAAGCASGGAALHAAVMAVASGLYDVAAATGAGRMMADALVGAADEAQLGLSCSGLYAIIMSRYMYEFSWRREHFAGIAINARANAMTNSNALLHAGLDNAAYAQAPVTADPMTALDVAPAGEGAASIIVARSDIAARFQRRPVQIAASAMATDTVALHDRADMLFPTAACGSAQAAYAQAGCAARDISLFEPHDACTIGAVLSLEAAGFAEKGMGVRLALDGTIGRDGAIPLCTMGGLLARGNVAGASGLYQAVEAALQLRGEAGANQINGARRALIQSMDGAGAIVATHILATSGDGKH